MSGRRFEIKKRFINKCRGSLREPNVWLAERTTTVQHDWFAERTTTVRHGLAVP